MLAKENVLVFIIFYFFLLIMVFRLTGETVITTFDLDRMYTPFFFARVKSYTAVSEQPL